MITEELLKCRSDVRLVPDRLYAMSVLDSSLSGILLSLAMELRRKANAHRKHKKELVCSVG